VTAILPASFMAPVSRLRTILLTAAKGAALIGVAVLIGIVLLQVVDNPTGGGDGGSSDTSTATGGTDADNGNGDNGGNNRGVNPADVSVIVLNGSGTAGAAQTQTDALAALGYETLTPTDALANQEPTTVACNAENQAAVEGLVGSVQGSAAAEYPAEPQPPEAAAADCIITLGTSTAAAPPT
jgi:LytR cell envelope-related transcriptional attenuator